ncbi:MAG: hypothetical protein SFV81_13400 [Pirellulaceae bacterium]|nr:hypothetical protein [Pirellulaceae bacterium]
MRLAFHGDNLERLTALLLRRLQSDPSDAAALLDLSVVLQLNAQPQLALELQAEALKIQQHYQFQSNPPSPSIRLLAIMGPGEVMANTPIEFLVEAGDVALELLYLGEGVPPPKQIPEHDVAFVAVCESDQSQPLLQQLHDVMQHWPRPFINSPASIARLSRDSVSRVLARGAGYVASDAQRLAREEVHNLANVEDSFPCIARPLDSHAGHGLAKLDTAWDLERYMRAQQSAEFYVAPFVDYRSPDGWFRKYRIVVIDGQPFASHMAISQKWMVHYLNADMLQNEKNRAEEAHFMETFDTNFASKHFVALQEIDRIVGLDYYSLDCGETQDGRLLIFEVDSGAVVHSMDSIDIFPYKAPQMERVFAAFRELLHRRLERSSHRQAA